MKERLNKLLALVMTFMMVFSSLPVDALAQTFDSASTGMMALADAKDVRDITEQEFLDANGVVSLPHLVYPSLSKLGGSSNYTVPLDNGTRQSGLWDQNIPAGNQLNAPESDGGHSRLYDGNAANASDKSQYRSNPKHGWDYGYIYSTLGENMHGNMALYWNQNPSDPHYYRGGGINTSEGHTEIGWDEFYGYLKTLYVPYYTEAPINVNKNYRDDFVIDGNVVEAQHHNGNDSFTISVINYPSKSNCEFAGWLDNATGKVWQIGESYRQPTANVIFTAQWRPSSGYVLIDPNGGRFSDNNSGMPRSFTEAEANAILAGTSSIQITYDDNNFKAWEKVTRNSDGTLNTSRVNSASSGDTIRAVWDQSKVTFDLNGGTGDGPAPRMVADGATIYLPDMPEGVTKDGYEFAGWSTTANANRAIIDSNDKALAWVYYPNDPFTVNGDTTLYAVWAPTDYANTQASYVQFAIYKTLNSQPFEPQAHAGGADYAIVLQDDQVRNPLAYFKKLISIYNDPVRIRENLIFEPSKADVIAKYNEVCPDNKVNADDYEVVWYVIKYQKKVTQEGTPQDGDQYCFYVDGYLRDKSMVTLRYDLNLKGASTYAEVTGRVPDGVTQKPGWTNVYAYDDSDNKGYEVNHLQRNNYTFLGWAYDRDATKPDFTAYPNQREAGGFDLQKDTVLYAVWEKNYVDRMDIVVSKEWKDENGTLITGDALNGLEATFQLQRKLNGDWENVYAAQTSVGGEDVTFSDCDIYLDGQNPDSGKYEYRVVETSCTDGYELDGEIVTNDTGRAAGMHFIATNQQAKPSTGWIGLKKLIGDIRNNPCETGTNVTYTIQGENLKNLTEDQVPTGVGAVDAMEYNSTTGTLTVNIKNTSVARLCKIPTGEYTITEVAQNVYDMDATKTVTTVFNGEQYTFYEQEHRQEIVNAKENGRSAPVTITVEKDKTTAVLFVNTLKPITMSLSKQLQSGGSTSDTFKFKVTFTKEVYVGEAETAATEYIFDQVSLNEARTVTLAIKGESSADYTVTELGYYEGGDTSQYVAIDAPNSKYSKPEDQTGKVSAGATLNVNFTNTLNAQCKVTYEYVGDVPANYTAPEDTNSYYSGQKATVKPHDTVPTDYTFEGWYVKNGETIDKTKAYNANDELTVTDNVTLVGIWRKKVTITATKDWADSANQDGKRDAVTLVLYANGSKVAGSEKVIAKDATDGALTVEWTEQPYSDDSYNKITYTVKEETELAGYTSEVNGNDYAFTVTNRHTPENVSVTVTKTWEDDGNAGNTRPDSIRVKLKAFDSVTNGQMSTYDNVELNEGNGWSYTWGTDQSPLPKYTNGHLVKYSVVEVNGDDFFSPEIQPSGEITGENGAKYTVTYGETQGVGGSTQTCTITNTLKDGTPTDPKKTASVTDQKVEVTINGDKTDFVRPGGKITYTVTYKNHTAQSATVTVTDTLPTGVAYVTGSSENNNAPIADPTGSDTLTWTIENVAPLASGTLTFEVKVDESIAGTEVGQNTANVKIGDHDPSAATSGNVPVYKPSLTIDKTVTSDTNKQYNVGDTISYKVVVTNTGDVPYEKVTLSDRLVTNLTGTITKADNDEQGTSASGNEFALGVGEKATFEYTYTVTGKDVYDASEATQDKGMLVNTATATGTPEGGSEEEPIKDTEKVTLVDNTRNIKVTKEWHDGNNMTLADHPDSVTVIISATGKDDVSLTITTTGSEPWSSTTEVPKYDSNGNEYQYAVTEQGAAGDTYTVGGKSYTVTVTGNMNDGFTVVNKLKDDTSKVPTKEKAEDTKYVDVTVGNETKKMLKVGDTFTYEIGYYNHTSTNATIIVTDTLPTGLDFVPADNGGTYNDETRTVTWTLTGVAPLTSGKVTVKVQVTKEALASASETNPSPTISNTASVKIGDNPEQKTEPDHTTIYNPKLKVEKKAEGQNGATEPYKTDDEIKYTVTVKNIGNATLTGISLTDSLADAKNLTINGTLNGASVSDLTSFTLNPSETATFTYTYTVADSDLGQSGTLGTIQNKATATVTDPQDPTKTITEEDEENVSTRIKLVIKADDRKQVPYSGNPEGAESDNAYTATNLREGDVISGVVIRGEETYVGTYTDKLDPTPTANTVTVTRGGNDVTGEYDIRYEKGDLKITGDPVKPEKTHDATYDGAQLGNTIEFKITVQNITNHELTNVTVSDETATIILHEGDTSYTVSDNVATIASLASGASVDVYATREVTEADITAKEITNTATVSAEGKAVPATDTVTPAPSNASLTITKTAVGLDGAAEPYTVGDVIKYTVTVTNDGNRTIENIHLSDVIKNAPDAAGTSLTIGTGTITGNPSSLSAEADANGFPLAPSAKATFTYTYEVQKADLGQGGKAGTLTNQASVTATNPDPTEPDISESSEEVTVETKTVVTATKVWVDEDNAGDTRPSEITLHLKKEGDDDTDVATATLDGTLDATETEAWKAEWIVNGLADGEDYAVSEDTVEKYDYEIAGTVQTGFTVTNKLKEDDNPDDPTKTKTDATVYVNFRDKNGNQMVKVGDTITYEISYYNYTVRKADITVTDTLPKGLELVEGQTWSGIDFTQSGSELKWVISQVAPLVKGTITVKVRVTEEALENVTNPSDPTVSNEASVQVGTLDPKQTNIDTTTIYNPALTVEKTVTSTNTSYKLGETIGYQVVVTNSGNVALNNIRLSDTLVADNTKITGKYADNSEASPEGFDLEPNASATFTYTYTVTEDDLGKDGTDGAYLSNTATATAPDPNGGEDIEAKDTKEVTTEDPNAALNVVKTAKGVSDGNGGYTTKTYYTEGDVITYEVTVTNTGNRTITGIRLTDAIQNATDETPRDLTIHPTGTISGNGAGDETDVNPNGFNLAPSATATFTYTYTVQKSDLGQDGTAGTLTNQAKVKATNPDADPDDPDVPDDITGESDKVAVKTQTVITAKKAWVDESATHDAITLKLKKGDSVVKTATLDASNSWQVEWIVDGEDATATYSVVEDPVPEGYTCVVTERATETDTTFTVTNVLTNPTKDVESIASVTYGGQMVKVGGTITYKITYYNDTAEAAKVTVTDTLPTGVEFVRSVPEFKSKTETDGRETVTWEFDTVPALSKGEITLIVQVNADAIPKDSDDLPTEDHPQVKNTAKVALNDSSDQKTTNETTVEVYNPALKVEKTVVDTGKKSYTFGDTISYLVEVTNIGNVNLTGIELEDDHMDTLTSASKGSETISKDSFNLAVGETATFRYTYTVKASDLGMNGSGTIKNTATATADNPDDPDSPEKITDTDTETVTTGEWTSELTIEKTASQKTDSKGAEVPYEVGDTITYTVVVTNEGTVPYNDVTLSDSLMAGKALSGEITKVSDNTHVDDVTSTKPFTLGVGEKATFTYEYTVTGKDVYDAAVAGNNGKLKNTATVTGTPEGGDPKEESDDEDVDIMKNERTLKVVKEWKDGNGTTLAAHPTSATVTVTGIASAGNDLVYENNEISTSDASEANWYAEKDVPIYDENGTPYTYTVTENGVDKGEITLDGKTYKVTYDNDDENNTVLTVTNTRGDDPEEKPAKTAKIPSSIRVSKGDETIEYVGLGEQIQYEIKATNYTNQKATLTVTDTLPEGVEYQSGSVSGTGNPAESTNADGRKVLTFEVKEMEPFTSITISFYVKVKENFEGFEIKANTANVTLGENIVFEPVTSAPVPVYNPKLEVEKEALGLVTEDANGNETVVARGCYMEGDTVRYQVTVKNIGNTDINTVTVHDAIEAAIEANNLETDYSVDLRELTDSTLKPDETASVTYSYTITAADVTAGSVKNVATASGTTPEGEDVPESEPDDETITTGDKYEVSVTVSDRELEYTGETLSGYTVPAEAQGNTATPAEGETPEYTIKGLENGDQLVVTYDPSNGTLVGEYTNGRFPSVKVIDKDGNDVTNQYKVNQTFGKLTIKGNPVDPTKDYEKEITEQTKALLGEKITYTITVKNIYQKELTDVIVKDPNATIVSGTGYDVETDVDGKTVAKIATLDVNGVVEVTAEYTVTEADIKVDEITNTATVQVTGWEETPTNTVTIKTDSPTPELTVKKEVTNDTTPTGESNRYAVGDTISYQVTVTNSGNVTLDGIQLTDSLAGISAINGTYDADNSDADPNGFDLEPNATATFTYTYKVTEADLGKVGASNGTVHNEATATATVPDPDNPKEEITVTSTDDEDTPTEPAKPSLEVVKTVNGVANADGTYSEKAIYTVGDEIFYTVTVENTGNVTVNDIKLTDAIQNANETAARPITIGNGTLTSDPANTGATPNPNRFSLAPNAKAEFTYSYTVTLSTTVDDLGADGTLGTLTNEAKASGTPNVPTDPDDPAPDPTKDEDDKPVNTVIKLPIKANDNTVDYDGQPHGENENDPYTSDPGDLETGHTLTSVTIEGEETDVGRYVDELKPTGFTVENANGDDVTDHYYPLYENGTLTIQTPNLKVEKKADVSTVRPGERIVYTVTVTNDNANDRNGTVGTAKNVTVTENLPANATLAATHSATKGRFDPATGIWTVGDLAAGESATLTLPMDASEDAVNGDVIKNTVVARSDNDKPDDPDDPSDETEIPVKFPILKVAKTIMAPAKNADGEHVVREGDTVRYQIKITNEGEGDARNIVLKDVLPEGLEITKTLPAATNDEGELTWVVPSLRAGSYAVINIYAVVTDKSVEGTIDRNVARITGEDDKDIPEDEQPTGESEEITVLNPRIEIEKSVSKTHVYSGDDISYTIKVTNTGMATARSVVVRDDLPAGLTRKSEELQGSIWSDKKGLYKISSLTPGDTVTIKIKAKVTAAIGRTIAPNVAIVTSENDKDIPEDERPTAESREVSVEGVKVFFIDWNGRVIAIRILPYRGSAIPPADPTRTGWDFSFWDGTWTDVIQDQYVYARYTPRQAHDSSEPIPGDHYGIILDAEIPLAGGYMSTVGDCFD